MQYHTHPSSNVALFIDADNVSSRNLETIMQQLQSTGNIVLKRAYGNWSKPNLKNWLTACMEYNVNAVQVTDVVVKKNISDIKIIIDIMETFHTKPQVDTFVLVTSDSDFTPIVGYLLENFKQVIGFGEIKTPNALKQAYSDFRYLLSEVVQPATPVQLPDTYQPNHVPAKNYATTSHYGKNPNHNKELINFINQIIDEKSENGELNTAILGAQLRAHPNIDIGKYGYSKVGDLLKNLDNFEVFIQGSSTQMVRKKLSNSQSQPIIAQTALDETTLTNAISQAIVSYQNDEGWANIGTISQYLQENYGLASNLGYDKLLSMIDSLSVFASKKENGRYYVRDTRLDEISNNDREKTEKTAIGKTSVQDLLNNHAFIDAIRESIMEVAEDGLANVQKLGTVLGQRGFSAKAFGYKNLAEMLRVLEIFELKGIGNINFVKVPQKKKTQPVVDENQHNDNIEDLGTVVDENQHNDNAEDLGTVVDENQHNDNVEDLGTGVDENQQHDNVENSETVVDTENKAIITLVTEPESEQDSQESLEHQETEAVIDDWADDAEILNLHDIKVVNENLDNIVLTLTEMLNEVIDDEEQPNTNDTVITNSIDENQTPTDSPILIEQYITEAINAQKDDDGWATIGDIGSYLRQVYDIKSTELGYRNVGELIAILVGFELKRQGRYVLARIADNPTL